MYLTPVGEDTLLFCDTCDYAANRQVAVFKKDNPPEEALKPVKKVSTPEISKISSLTGFLNIPPSRTAKAVFYMAERQGDQAPLLIFAVIRVDMALNETKLTHAISSANCFLKEISSL